MTSVVHRIQDKPSPGPCTMAWLPSCLYWRYFSQLGLHFPYLWLHRVLLLDCFRLINSQLIEEVFVLVPQWHSRAFCSVEFHPIFFTPNLNIIQFSAWYGWFRAMAPYLCWLEFAHMSWKRAGGGYSYDGSLEAPLSCFQLMEYLKIPDFLLQSWDLLPCTDDLLWLFVGSFLLATAEWECLYKFSALDWIWSASLHSLSFKKYF